MRHFFSLLFHGKFRELLLGPTDDGFIQFFRFMFVGGTATVVDIGVGWLFFHYVFLDNLSLFGFTVTRDVQSTAIGFLLGIIVNYFLSILWVFRKPNMNRWKEFLAFAAIGLVGLCIKSASIAVLGLVLPAQTDLLHLLKSFIGTMIAMVWNFSARKLLLYTDRTKKEHP